MIDIQSALIDRHTDDEEEGILIMVDWSKYSSSINYEVAVCYVPKVAEVVADYMVANIKIIKHVIGHSLGAHVAGVMGQLLLGKNTIIQLTSKTILILQILADRRGCT